MRTTLAMTLTAAMAATTAGAETLTYADLCQRATDVRRLATLPAEGETNQMASSYNRRSRYDEKTDRYLFWDTNADGGAPIDPRKFESEIGTSVRATTQTGEVVLAELEGPGVIWRTWAAATGDGAVKVYLDGNEQPAIDAPFTAWFNGTTEPFTRKGLTYNSAKGFNSYVPISFGKSCRIFGAPKWGQYFHFTWTKLPAGTQVPTFSTKLSAEDAGALDALNEAFTTKLGQHVADAADSRIEAKALTIAPGKRESIKLDGARAITGLTIKLDGTLHMADQIAALRELCIEMRWDGEAKPSVWSPLGDFFGSAIGFGDFKSLMSGMSSDGQAYAYWYMPFEKGAEITFSNDGPVERKLSVQVMHEPLAGDVSTLSRFHAKWHRDAFMPERADRWPDWTVLKAEGRGRFCGFALHVWNPRAGHNRQFGRDGQHWWGEGDEKFFVDGEKFPSTYGTGTEDYFGYAWCWPQIFQQALHGQTTSQNNKGHQSVFRYQVADNVPFQKSFDGAIEKYYNNEWPTLYAATAFFYLDKNGKDLYEPVALKDRVGYYDLTPAMEGENLKVLSVTGGWAYPQDMPIQFGTGESMWTAGKQCAWRGGKVGDKLALAVPVTADGRYVVKVGVTRGVEYGIAQMRIGDKSSIGPTSAFSRMGDCVEIVLGEHDLKRGEVPLNVEMLGSDENGPKGFAWGIDYVKLVPVETASTR